MIFSAVRIAGMSLFAFLGLAVTGCEQVVPIVPYDPWEFEGFTVYSHVPDEPVGVVYLFHGSYGNASFAVKIETLEVTNILVSRGYAVVATESTLRRDSKRWQVKDPSLDTNADLARIARLHDALISSTALAQQTPMFGIGMSNGARMVSLFGQAFSDAGYPIVAVAPFMGRVAESVKSAGGMRIPSFFVVAEHDTVTSNVDIVEDYEMALLNGVSAQIYTKIEEPLLPYRFTRIPSVTTEESIEIKDLFRSTGAWDDNGKRVVPVKDAIASFTTLKIPPALSRDRSRILGQVKAMLAVHQFVGIYTRQLADFFDANLEIWGDG